LPHLVVTIAIPVLRIVVSAHALLSLPSDFGSNERVLWRMWATVPMVTLVVDANLTGQKKEGIGPKIRQVSAESASNAPPVEPST